MTSDTSATGGTGDATTTASTPTTSTSTTNPVSAFPDTWIMADSAHAAASEVKPLGRADEAFLALDAPSDPVRDAHIRSLRLWAPHASPITAVPPRLHDFPNLTGLTLGTYADPALVGGLTVGSIPGTVTDLTVVTGGRPTRWPRGLSLPGVRSLTTDGPTTFGPDTFPHLEKAHLAPTRTSFAALLQLPTLSTLQLRTVPLPAPELFETVAHLPLVDLGLLGGRKITGLDGIGLLPGLLRLRLQSLPLLTSVAALADLEHLEELLVLYCSRIEDIATVTTLPAIRRFDAYGCTGIGLEAIESFVDEHSAHRQPR